MKNHKETEGRRSLKLLKKFDNDDHSRFAAPDYVENNFDIGNDGQEASGTGRSLGSGISSDEEGLQEDGEFFGVGPKGYRRRDELIYEDACELLMRHRGIDASQIVVSVRKGVVTLNGKVDSKKVKELSGKILKNLTGVVRVENELIVLKDYDHPRGPVSMTEKDLGLS